MEVDSPLPISITEQRRLNTYRGSVRRRTPNYIVRSTAKQLAASNDANLCRTLKFPCYVEPPNTRRRRTDLSDGPDGGLAERPGRPHLEKDIRALVLQSRLEKSCKALGDKPAVGRNPSLADVEEGQALARSDVRLPSDSHRLVRRPTLEREEAFRVPGTSKVRVLAHPTLSDTEDGQIAELYQMGLLYDSKELSRDDVFDLNSITHDEPVYSVRPAKKPRKARKAGLGPSPLSLELSYADLGDDESIAKFLSSGNDSAEDAVQHSSRRNWRYSAPIRVIYELANPPSIDVETSQPPDLIADDFDVFDSYSGDDDDDVPTQREVLEGANTPSSDTWILLD